MSAAENLPDDLAELREVLAIADPDKRLEKTGNVLRSYVHRGMDELTWARACRMVTAARVMSVARLARLEREARELLADDPGTEHVAAEVAKGGHPADVLEVLGMPSAVYLPGDGEPRPPGGTSGEIWERKGRYWSRVLPWAPTVPRVLELPGDDAPLCRYYEIRAGGRSVVVSDEELGAGEPWRRLPVAGTASRHARELLAHVAQTAAEGLEPLPALGRTGWHQAEDGARFYVFADGRAWPPREVHLVGVASRPDLAAAAAPVHPRPELIPGALRTIAERGRGPCLVGLGMGVRSLGHSLHKVLGGVAPVGDQNTGKTCVAWHARSLLIARPGRVGAWPPLASATFTATPTALEGALNFEADMPALVDDAPLHDESTSAEVAAVNAKFELVFRSLANDAPVRPRESRSLLPREARYVRSPAFVTGQEWRAQNSLKRRTLMLRLERGDVDVSWYRAERAGRVPELLAALRTLGEHLVIPWLHMLGDQAPAELARRDAEALELLRPSLEAELPDWESSAEGIAGVVDIAAAALAGLLIAAEVTPGDHLAELAAPAVAYLVRCLVDQAADMAEHARGGSVPQAVADILHAALHDGRAHVRDAAGDVPWPAVADRTEQEQGLELVPGRDRAADGDMAVRLVYRGRGVPLYSLPEDDALGVPSEGLLKLLRAAGDARINVRTTDALQGYLVREGAAIANASGRGAHVKKISGKARRLVYLRAGLIFPPADPPAESQESAQPSNDGSGGVTGVTGVTEQVRGAFSSDRAENQGVTGVTEQVRGGFAAVAPAEVERSENIAEQQTETGYTLAEAGYTLADVDQAAALEALEALAAADQPPADDLDPGARPVETIELPALADVDQAADVAEQLAEALCDACGTRLDPVLVRLGWTAHVNCAAPAEADQAAPVAAAAELPSTEVVTNTRPGAEVRDRGRPWLVLSAAGRAYAQDGEVVALPRSLAEIRHVGDLAALALELGARVLWVPRKTREVLGLPAALPPLGKTEGWPHMFTEAADPAEWDVWPAEPVGLAGWLDVYRQPRTRREGAALAFPEWLAPVGDGAQLGDLAPADLAAALTLLWRATTYEGNGGRYGGVNFARSPGATMRRLLDASSRRRRSGALEAREMPPPYRRGKGSVLERVPGPHMAPALEVPPGWLVAELDVRSCFVAAVIGTDFGVGEAERREGLQVAEARKLPGAHQVTAPAEAAVIHPALWPMLPPARRGRAEVSGPVDTLALAWLADRGVPLRLGESWVWPERSGRRVYASVAERLAAAKDDLGARGGGPAEVAAAIIKAMYARGFGGWLASDFGGERDPDDPWHAPDHWLTVRVQAEVRKQRNLLPALEAGTLVVLGSANVDSVFAAAPGLAELQAAPGTGGRPLIADRRGKFRIVGSAPVTPELAAALADRRSPAHARLAAIREALGGADQDGGPADG